MFSTGLQSEERIVDLNYTANDWGGCPVCRVANEGPEALAMLRSGSNLPLVSELRRDTYLGTHFYFEKYRTMHRSK